VNTDIPEEVFCQVKPTHKSTIEHERPEWRASDMPKRHRWHPGGLSDATPCVDAVSMIRPKFGWSSYVDDKIQFP
jgi:hypothetical protein